MTTLTTNISQFCNLLTHAGSWRRPPSNVSAGVSVVGQFRFSHGALALTCQRGCVWDNRGMLKHLQSQENRREYYMVAGLILAVLTFTHWQWGWPIGIQATVQGGTPTGSNLLGQIPWRHLLEGLPLVALGVLYYLGRRTRPSSVVVGGMSQTPTDTLPLREEEKIKITLPLDGEVLTDEKRLGPNSVSYGVHGTLKSLRADCEVWLITTDKKTRQYWPQGFADVQYERHTGTWRGRVYGGRSPLQVVAVVAPPTSQQFFRYYQKLGELRQRNQENKPWYEPLDAIPAECHNIASVNTQIP
jgi:hypothetical protein